MIRVLAASGAALVMAILYFLFWPVPVEPISWHAPINLGLVDPYGPDDRLTRTRAIDLRPYQGPEDAALAPDGTLYVTTTGGTILSVTSNGAVQPAAEVGGRPLGIEIDADGALLIANAHLGLQRLATDGSLTTLVDHVDGQPIAYANDVAIAANGTVYFSEASTRFGAAQFGGSYAASLLDLIEHGAHGRIIEYQPTERRARVIVDHLNFANGVAVSHDQSALLIAETGAYRILKHWLRGPKAGSTDILIDNLPGFPDNINNGIKDNYWIGLVAPRNALLDRLSDKPFLRKMVQRLPARLRPQADPSSHVVAIDDAGEILMNLQDPGARFPALTGVVESRDALFLTSLFGSELGIIMKDDL